MIQITGTRNLITVVIDEKIITIPGEMIIGGFIANKDAIKKWDKPYNIEISQKEKEEIISKIIKKTENSHMIITFE